MPGAENGQAQAGTGAATDENQQNGTAGAPDQGSDNDEAEAKPGMTLEEAQAEIKKLRKESASRRTSNKALEERLQAMEGMTSKMKQALGIEDEEVAPEVRLQQLQETAHVQQLNTEILGIAYETGIPPENLEYFTFLFSKALDGLQEDGQELTEEDIDGIIAKAKAAGGGSGPQRSGTSGANPPAANQGQPQHTPDSFAKMNQLQKGELYAKNPDLYNSLFAEAKTKGLLFKAT